MKWGSLSKAKKILVGTGVLVGITAGVFAAYTLRGTVGLVSNGSPDAEAFPVDIDIDTPSASIGNIKPFLAISESEASSANNPAVKRTSKTMARKRNANSPPPVLLANNSGEVVAKSGTTRIPDPDMSEGYKEPGDGTTGSPTGDLDISTPLGALPYIAYWGDAEGGGGGSNITVASDTQREDNSNAGPTNGEETAEKPGTSPVPEPSTMILLGTGLVSLAVYGKRRLEGKETLDHRH